MSQKIIQGAVAAVVLVSLSACNRASDSISAFKPDTELYSYLPSDAVLIAGARIELLRSSKVYAALRERLPAEARPYEKEASEMVVASDGTRTLVLARGKFDRKRLETDWKGAPVEFLAGNLIAVGDKSAIDAARRRTGSPLTKQIPLAALWLVSNGQVPAVVPRDGNLGNISRMAQDMRLAVVAVNMNSNVHADARLEFVLEKSAEQAQTAMKGFIGLARLSTPEGQEQRLQVLDAIQVERDKTRIKVLADWPAGLVDSLLATLPGPRR